MNTSSNTAGKIVFHPAQNIKLISNRKSVRRKRIIVALLASNIFLLMLSVSAIAYAYHLRDNAELHMFNEHYMNSTEYVVNGEVVKKEPRDLPQDWWNY